jgi:hypothetical protein
MTRLAGARKAGALLGLLAAALLLGFHSAQADAMQHVWVHYDYMVGPDGESFAPDPAGIQIVVDAFKRHGVTLHIDPQHTAIPLHSVIVFDAPGNSVYSFDPACTGPDAVGFSSLKTQYFHPTSDHPWHYVIFGKYVQIGSSDDEQACYAHHDLPFHSYSYGNTGYAELPGYNFVVTPGLNADNPDLTDFFDFDTGQLTPGWPPPAYAWATWFMHELGHNLGLYHGGYGSPAGGGLFFTDNNKPNYVSVMNYADSFGGMPIITSSTTTGSGFSYRVDYSDETLAPLNETSLDEAAGVGPTLHPNDYIQWFGPGVTFGFGLAAGPLDWNNNGTATDSGVLADLNADGKFTILKGFDDWAEVHQYLADENEHPKQTQGATP